MNIFPHSVAPVLIILLVFSTDHTCQFRWNPIQFFLLSFTDYALSLSWLFYRIYVFVCYEYGTHMAARSLHADIGSLLPPHGSGCLEHGTGCLYPLSQLTDPALATSPSSVLSAFLQWMLWTLVLYLSNVHIRSSCAEMKGGSAEAVVWLFGCLL